MYVQCFECEWAFLESLWQSGVETYRTANDGIHGLVEFCANKTAATPEEVHLAIVVGKDAWVDAKDTLDRLLTWCELSVRAIALSNADTETAATIRLCREEEIVFAVALDAVGRPHRV